MEKREGQNNSYLVRDDDLFSSEKFDGKTTMVLVMSDSRCRRCGRRAGIKIHSLNSPVVSHADPLAPLFNAAKIISKINYFIIA